MTIEELNTIINQHQAFMKMIDDLDRIIKYDLMTDLIDCT